MCRIQVRSQRGRFAVAAERRWIEAIEQAGGAVSGVVFLLGCGFTAATVGLGVKLAIVGLETFQTLQG